MSPDSDRNPNDNKTVAVLLTGAGRGAVATVLLHGTLAEQIVLQRFRSKSSIKKFLLSKPYFGDWSWQDYSEELVVCQTQNDTFEIHCHGGRMASSVILDSLVDAGAQKISATEWLQRSVPDRFMRKAMELLPAARTERAATLLLAQTRGVLRESLDNILTLLLQNESAEATRAVERLIQMGKLGAHLANHFTVVLVGPPNAGKSSLINALVGFERAIVYDQPGTTRDLVRADTAVEGWPIQLVDTAGIRASDNVIEQEGIRLAKEIVQNSDLALIVRDLQSEATWTPQEFGLQLEQQSITVGTKADLRTESDDAECDVVTSAVTGQGIDELLSLIAHRLVPVLPEMDEAIPLDDETMQQLDIAMDYLTSKDKAIDRAIQIVRSLLNNPAE